VKIGKLRKQIKKAAQSPTGILDRIFLSCAKGICLNPNAKWVRSRAEPGLPLVGGLAIVDAGDP